MQPWPSVALYGRVLQGHIDKYVDISKPEVGVHIPIEVRQAMGLEFDPDPLIVMNRLLRDANVPLPDFNVPPRALEWLAGTATMLAGLIDTNPSSVEAVTRDSFGLRVDSLVPWLAPVVLAVVAPGVPIPSGKSGDLLKLCKAEIKLQLPKFGARVIRSWNTHALAHDPLPEAE